MSSSHDSFNIRAPPRFDGVNFPVWKIKMSVFLKSMGRDVFLAIGTNFIEPEVWADTYTKTYEANAKATYALMQALNDDDLGRIINCASAYDIWNTLIITHEGTSQVKRAKIDLLTSEYEDFCMLDNESIDDMLNRFNTICNGLVSLGEPLDDDHKVRKIIRSLPKSWEVKATTLKELNDANAIKFNVFMGNLKTHEMEMRARANKDTRTKEVEKKSVALRASKAKAVVASDYESSSEEEEENDLTKVVKALSRMILKGGKKKKKEKREEKRPVTCYKCKQPGHYSNECPLNKRTKKKVLKVSSTWDDDSSSASGSEMDNAHMCFMGHDVAQDNSSCEVNSQSSSSSQNEISYNDLVEGFRDLMLSYKRLKSKFLNLKKEQNCSISRLNEVSKEKDKALEELSKAKNDLVLFDLSFNEEMKDLKTRVACLSTTLGDCASHTHKLANLCSKKNDGFKNNVFRKPQPQHTRKEHKRLFHCKVCGRDGHLAVFCYDNIANAQVGGQNPKFFCHKNQWVPKDHRFPPHVWEAMN